MKVYAVARELPEVGTNIGRYMLALMRITNREISELANSYLIAGQTVMRASRENPMSLMEAVGVLQHSQRLIAKGAVSAQETMLSYVFDQIEEGTQALMNSVYNYKGNGETLGGFTRREAEVMESVANFNEQIEKIKDEFGFHFNTPDYKLVHETDAFRMYQVLPLKKSVAVRDDVKPVLLLPPYIMGVNLLSFLPYENKSYTHAFANAGIPTYVRVVKDIMQTEAVQRATPEDDCLQTLELCQKLKEIHGKKVVLNGTCQSGYISLINILSGKFTDVCDTLITNVTPIDGTYNPAISSMPQMHSDFVTIPLANGNKVANGYMLSLGMRFVAIDRETPLVKVLNQASLHKATEMNPGKTPAALFYWLLNERVHLPIEIAKMSTSIFRHSIADDGTLPVQLFGKSLNIKDLAKLGVKWYQNYALKDDLVPPACATAGNKYLEGLGVLESVAYYGGHVQILTSPHAKKAPVNGEFVDAAGRKARGPVKFMLDEAAA